MSHPRNSAKSLLRLLSVTVVVLGAASCKYDSALPAVCPLPLAPSVAPATATLRVGQMMFLTASLQTCDSAIMWTSSSNTIVTVSSSGGLTAVAVGSAVISATRSGLTGTASIIVVPQ